MCTIATPSIRYPLSDALFNGISNAERGYHHVVCGWCMRKHAYSKFICFTSTKVNGHLSTHQIELNSHIHRMNSVLTQWLTDISHLSSSMSMPSIGRWSGTIQWLCRGWRVKNYKLANVGASLINHCKHDNDNYEFGRRRRRGDNEQRKKIRMKLTCRPRKNEHKSFSMFHSNA